MVWHNQGNVWDKIATDWACGEDWISERKKRKSLADKTAFVTFALDSMKLSAVHRKVKGKGKGKQAGSRPPRKLGPADATFLHKERRIPRCNCVATVRWLAKQKYQETIGLIQKKPCTHDGKGR